MRASLFKRNGRYHAKIQLDAWPNEKRVSLGTTDKRIAAIELEKRVKDFELVEAGLLAPLAMRKAAQKSLGDLCVEYVGQLDKAELTIRRYRGALKLVREWNQWTQLSHVTESAFREWLRESTLRASTRNDYLAVWRGFFKWLKRQRLVKDSPLHFIEPVSEIKTEREYRCAFTPEEVERLLAAAPPHRRVIYRLYLETGLRSRELRGLRVGDFTFACGGGSAGASRSASAPVRGVGDGGAESRDGKPPVAVERSETGASALHVAGGSLPPAGAGEGAWGRRSTVRVPSSITKNHQNELMLLNDETAAELRALIGPDALPFQPALRGRVPRCETFYRDLAAARISPVDAMGRRRDLHALRKTYGAGLALAGTDPYALRQAMRHSDLKLTMKVYMDAAQLRGPVAAAVATLPWFRDPVRREDRQAEKA